MDDKQKLLTKLNDALERVDVTIEQISEGDRTFSEVGEYFYDFLGDRVSSVLAAAIAYIKEAE
ncbi:hypothetical protein [Brevibacillus agri]|uniref:hypothetical protein n=1 Tax=Brevibacillus agri TaxID=51101 RepID=UPI000472541F|nr:hypothetical protein [Brevibacillus agri]